MTLANPALEGVLACGTDGERAIIDGFRRNFRHAPFLRYFIRFKDNLEREMTWRGLRKDLKVEFIADIFGKQDGDVKYAGFVDCNDESEFQVKVNNVEEKWNARETASKLKTSETFFQWFKKNKVYMERYMLRHKRTEAGLGDPPIEFTTNNNKAANLVVKIHLSFQMKELDKFIEEIKELVEQHFRDEDRAIFGRGPYEVSEEFRHLAVDSNRWAKMSVAQKQAANAKFRKTGIDGRKLHLGAASSSISSSTKRESVEFSVTAETSGISTVAMPILTTMFNKAKELLRADPPIVIPQPASDNGAYLVGSYGNKLYTVKIGKAAGALFCDKFCFHRSTGICEHVLRVVHKKGNLQAFMKWFTKHGKKGLRELATNDGPVNAGNKPSKRKRSNAKRAFLQ
eukprot:gene20955-23006_t